MQSPPPTPNSLIFERSVQSPLIHHHDYFPPSIDAVKNISLNKLNNILSRSNSSVGVNMDDHMENAASANKKGDHEEDDVNFSSYFDVIDNDEFSRKSRKPSVLQLNELYFNDQL